MKGTEWWINRVLVQPDARGKGLGRMVVDEMVELIRNRGGKTVMVCPGGYDIPYADQCAFYEACGFEYVGDETYVRRL